MVQKPTKIRSRPKAEEVSASEEKSASNWKIIIFLLPGLGGNSPKPPNGKNWLDLLLLLLKVAAAAVALWKAVEVVG